MSNFAKPIFRDATMILLAFGRGNDVRKTFAYAISTRVRPFSST